jgi:hypothetical protein
MRGGAEGGSVGLLSLGPTFPVGAGSFRALRKRDRPKARHNSLTEWAGQLLVLLRRWYPEREIVALADSTYASLKLLEDRCGGLSNPITFIITRLRLDALYERAPPRYGGPIVVN